MQENEIMNIKDNNCTFSYLYVEGFGWENTILIPSDFETVIRAPLPEEDGQKIFYAYNGLDTEEVVVSKLKGLLTN